MGIIKKTQFSSYPLEKISEVLKEIILESPDSAFLQYRVGDGHDYTAGELKGITKNQIVLPGDERNYLYTDIDPDTGEILYITTFYIDSCADYSPVGCICIPRKTLLMRYKKLRECLKD